MMRPIFISYFWKVSSYQELVEIIEVSDTHFKSVGCAVR